MLNSLKSIVKRIQDSKREAQILILLSFLITFAIVRTVTHLQKFGILPNQNGVLHIHHLVPGILLLLISGYVGLSFWASDRIRHFMAILFGIGAALTIDEFALWLYLRDVYWERQGRDSIDAMIYVIIIFSIIFVISEVHDHKWIKRIFKK
ncbi:MAG: hypothetical protein M1277_00030 [Patescibacteria group bacterium]|nr:hypothetical protein [Patescibacteria group bacterium]